MKLRKPPPLIWFAIFLVGVGALVFNFESNFVDPNEGLQVPVALWKVDDLKAVADEASRGDSESRLSYSEFAKIAQIDLLQNDVFQLSFSETNPFSAFTDVVSGERFILSHDADLFSRWDDIYQGGAVAALTGIDRDTSTKVFYPLIVFSPDFDTQSLEITFSIRNQSIDKRSSELLSLVPAGYKEKLLELFVAVDLVDATLIVAPVVLPSGR